MGTLNLLIYIGCQSTVAESTSSGPEGIGSAFMAVACLMFSLVLTGLGLNQCHGELSRKAHTKKTLIASLVAFSPLVLWGISTLVRLKTKH